MTRSLRKREGEALADAGVADRDRGARLARRSSSSRRRSCGGAAHPTIKLPPRAPDTNLQAIDQLMEREPERVAAQVKQWMAED